MWIVDKALTVRGQKRHTAHGLTCRLEGGCLSVDKVAWAGANFSCPVRVTGPRRSGLSTEESARLGTSRGIRWTSNTLAYS